MKRADDEDRLVHLLRRAGTDVELDRARVRRIVAGGIPTGPVRMRPDPLHALSSLRRSPPPARPARSRRDSPPRGPVQVASLPVAAALATLLVIVINITGMPRSDTIRKITGTSSPPSAPAATTPAASSPSVPSATATTQAPASSPSAGTTLPGPGEPGSSHPAGSGGGAGSGVSVTVLPVSAGQTFTLPLHQSRDWFAIESGGRQAHKVKVSPTVGPAQIGNGSVVESGPFSVNWRQGAASSPAGGAQSWVLVPGAVRNVPSVLKIPARLHWLPATITLLAGSVGGSASVTVRFDDPATGPRTVKATLPACGDARCPAIVTVRLSSTKQVKGSSEVMIELAADRPDSRVGLAAVELD